MYALSRNLYFRIIMPIIIKPAYTYVCMYAVYNVDFHPEIPKLY